MEKEKELREVEQKIQEILEKIWIVSEYQYISTNHYLFELLKQNLTIGIPICLLGNVLLEKMGYQIVGMLAPVSFLIGGSYFLAKRKQKKEIEQYSKQHQEVIDHNNLESLAIDLKEETTIENPYIKQILWYQQGLDKTK